MKQRHILLLSIFFFVIHNYSFTQDLPAAKPTVEIDTSISNTIGHKITKLLAAKDYKGVIARLDTIEQEDPYKSYFYTALKIHFAFIAKDFDWILSHKNEIRFISNGHDMFEKNIESYDYNTYANTLWTLTKAEKGNIYGYIENSHYNEETKDFLRLLAYYYYSNKNIILYNKMYSSMAYGFIKKYPESAFNSFIYEKCIISYSKKENFGIGYGLKATLAADKPKDLDASKSDLDIGVGIEVQRNRNIVNASIVVATYTVNKDINIGNKHFRIGDTINNVQLNIGYQRAIPIYREFYFQPFVETGFSYNKIKYRTEKKKVKSRLGNGWNVEAGTAIFWKTPFDTFSENTSKTVNNLEVGLFYSYKYVNIDKSRRFSLMEGSHQFGIILKASFVTYPRKKD
ncbi:MAG: hypothetical protein ACEPOV_03075 [Hyphomicrobiales bacterium]